MSDRTSRKIPVNERQFAWVQNDDTGDVVLFAGPTIVSPTATERVVTDDGKGGFIEDTSGKPQQMIELGDNEYAVLYNPLAAPEPDAPNGKFKQGRNEGKPLKNGTRQMIPGPASFYLRPGQRAEIRDSHKLKSNQYLVVEVYGEVDKSAQYYGITAQSAAIKKATADGGKKDGETRTDTTVESLRRGQLIVIRGLDTQYYVPPTGVDIVPDTSVDASGAGVSATTARALLGQLGDQNLESATPTPERRRRARGSDIVDQSARARHAAQQVYQAPMAGPTRGGEIHDGAAVLDYMPEERSIARGASAMHTATPVNYAASSIGNAPVGQTGLQGPAGPAGPGGPAGRPGDMSGKRSFAPAAASGLAMPEMRRSVVVEESFTDDIEADETLRKQLEREAKQARLIRNAVVLSEKEFCVIIDADGKREIKKGPARVFPGPYDTFMIAGSRNRVYDAYELLPTRSLWLRVIASITRDELQKKLPHGYKLEDKKEFNPGDELLLTGVSSFFVPFNEIEVLSPQTGQAVVGNDHTSVLIEAIGIDQKSGIYVRDLATGEVRLVKGKLSYTVDPRKEVQIVRTVQPDQWNLWIACNDCKSKQVSQPVRTPWALSVVVPPNTAVLATSATGQRVIEGPCVTLLEYEESLQTLTLSTGTPKKDDSTIKTAFLRTTGNRVSDIITVETSDFVRVSVKVSYSVTFTGTDKKKWFTHENYIQFLVDHLRSILRGKVRTISLQQFWPQAPVIVRDTILGEKPKDGQRPGRTFSENGAQITEVEVLTVQIDDKALSDLMSTAQSNAVKLQIGDRQAHDEFVSKKLRNEINKEQTAIEVEARQREAKTQELIRRLQHESQLDTIRNAELQEKEKLTLSLIRESESLKARIERERQGREAQAEGTKLLATAEAEATQIKQQVEVEHKEKLHALELALINARSAATVAEHNSVQKGLIEALTGLGDKVLLSEVAENMNLVSLFKGQTAAQVLSNVLGGTKLGGAVERLTGNGANRLAGVGAPTS